MNGGSELSRGWRAVLACFAAAIFAWGFGSYGQGVYLEELHRAHGWPTSVLGGATTIAFLLSAGVLPWVGAAVEWSSPRVLILAGVALLAAGVSALSQARALWQVFPCELLIGLGWSCCGSAALSIALSHWFNQQRSLALSLALNGASAAGMVVAPAMIVLSRQHGIALAVPMLALGLMVAISPPIWFGLARTPTGPRAPQVADAAQRTVVSRSAVLATRRFWSVALPFALALFGQMGLFVFQVSYLTPRLGAAGTSLAVGLTSTAGMSGRLTLGLWLDRLPQRPVSAAAFAGLALVGAVWLAFPGQPIALFVASAVFGACIGNIITLPTLVIHREFPAGSFATVLGLSTAVSQFAFALAPAILGALRDVTGSFAAPFGVCAGLELVAAALILRTVRDPLQPQDLGERREPRPFQLRDAVADDSAARNPAKPTTQQPAGRQSAAGETP